jgi:flagellar biosynthesis/type III secretory pathway protein FliH
MPETLTVHLDKPSSSVRVLDGYSIAAEAAGFDSGAINTNSAVDHTVSQGLEAEKASYLQICQTLNGVIAKFNQFCDTAFVSHKEEIAKLAVEIARKILIRKVEDGDYEIESIVREAIEKAPSRQELVVKLNSQDLTTLQKVQQDNGDEMLTGIKLVADADVKKAECIVESPKGIIESLIDAHLEQISKALIKAE